MISFLEGGADGVKGAISQNIFGSVPSSGVNCHRRFL
jgi:hypothetical protein